MKKPKLSLVHGFAPPENVEELALNKLRSSGLSRIDARRLGITWHDAAETASWGPGFWPLPSLRIPYLQPDDQRKPMVSAPGWPSFFRARALREPVPCPEDFRKYSQPVDSGVCAYFPALTDWGAIVANYQTTLIITEGELKAAKATLEGHPTIGLGGVNSYGSLYRRGVRLLPELEAFIWPRREVVIIYDSDLPGNANICRALNDLAGVLTDRGALVKTVILPSLVEGSKTGLDDFLLVNSSDDLTNLIDGRAIPLALGMPLWQMNEDYAYVDQMDRIINRRSGKLMTVQALHNKITSRTHEQAINANGTASLREVSVSARWMDWPMRQDANRLTYDPRFDPMTLLPSQATGARPFESDYNTWTGWGVTPAPGDVAPFLRLVAHIFFGAELGTMEWFLRWCAYPLQYPGTKMFSSVVIHGVAEGTGKSLIGITLGRIYGQNYTAITQDILSSGFNEWAVGRQFVMGDDVTGSDKRQDLDRLKVMITQESMRINAKNQPTYEIPDCINYLWTSNHPNAFFLGDEDRRFFIHEVQSDRLDDAFYLAYDAWFKTDAAIAAIFDYLLHLNLGDFNPNAKAFATTAKSRMTYAARSDLSNWIRDLRAAPDELLMVGSLPMAGDLFTARQLVLAFAAQVGVPAESIPTARLSRELSHARFRQVQDGRLVRVPGATGAERYWAIRNTSRWATATLAEVQAHLGPAPASAAPPTPARKGKKY